MGRRNVEEHIWFSDECLSVCLSVCQVIHNSN